MSSINQVSDCSGRLCKKTVIMVKVLWCLGTYEKIEKIQGLRLWEFSIYIFLLLNMLYREIDKCGMGRIPWLFLFKPLCDMGQEKLDYYNSCAGFSLRWARVKYWGICKSRKVVGKVEKWKPEISLKHRHAGFMLRPFQKTTDWKQPPKIFYTCSN